jgi:hypothetical protein
MAVERGKNVAIDTAAIHGRASALYRRCVPAQVMPNSIVIWLRARAGYLAGKPLFLLFSITDVTYCFF